MDDLCQEKDREQDLTDFFQTTWTQLFPVPRTPTVSFLIGLLFIYLTYILPYTQISHNFLMSVPGMKQLLP